jgi:hypothetical protein
MKTLIAGAVALSALTFAGYANAAITISAGNFGGLGVHSTPHLKNQDPVTGLAGSDLVTFTADVGMDTDGNGESTYSADKGEIGALTIAFTNFYRGVTFNLNVPNKGSTDFLLLVNGGAFSFTETGLGNGQNKFRLAATGSDFIHTLAFTFTGSGIDDIRQIRVKETGTVPEPATWALMIVGFGGMGAALRRRRASALA